MNATAWPRTWVGTWTATDGKAISISWNGAELAVTARPGIGQTPYRSAELLHGGTKPIHNLPARCVLHGHRHLELEAGTPGVGPTYRLYPVTETPTGLHAAADPTPVDKVLLLPNTIIGLYDDYDDDLGVPWAYPLNPLRWSGEGP